MVGLFSRESENKAKQTQDGSIELKDKSDNTLLLSDDDLSRHVLLLGESGSGKTNVFTGIIPQIDYLSNKLIIFDPKGDYKKAFFNPTTDFMLSGIRKDYKYIRYWNIFREIEASSPYMLEKRQVMKQIALSLFKGKENSSQPFFSDASRGLFLMIIEHQLNLLWSNTEYKNLATLIESCRTITKIREIRKRQKELFEELADTELNNKRLIEIIKNGSLTYYRDLLSREFPGVYGYLGSTGENYTTGLSVIGEMQSVILDIFDYTNFAEYEADRDFAVCEFINHKKGKLFIEFSFNAADTLTPVYSLILDLAIKTQQENHQACGNKLYLILDELKTAPIQNLDNVLAVGRSQGIRLVCGLQSIEQLKLVYGDYEANVIMEGFGTLFCFQLQSAATSREYVIKRLGQYGSFPRKATGNELNVVDESLLLQLKCGQAVIKKQSSLYPAFFDFKLYESKEEPVSLETLADKFFANNL